MTLPAGTNGIRQSLASFRKEREADWKAFEALLARVEKRAPRALSEDELLSLPLLYRSALSSLSVARATSLDSALIAYLEALCLRGYFYLYGARRSLRARVGDFFLRDWPAAMLRSVLYDGGTTHFLSGFAAYLFTHNTQVAILAFALGFAFAVPSVLLILMNGCMLGAIFQIYMAKGLGFELGGWLSIHATTEMFAIALAGADRGKQIDAGVLREGVGHGEPLWRGEGIDRAAAKGKARRAGGAGGRAGGSGRRAPGRSAAICRSGCRHSSGRRRG